MLIDNQTDLSYKIIGDVIDKYKENYILNEISHKSIFYFKFIAGGKKYDCQVVYFKRYTKFTVREERKWKS